MKTLSVLLLALGFLAAGACQKDPVLPTDAVQFTGIIEKMPDTVMTTYMYGEYRIMCDTAGYLIKSDVYNLEDYLNTTVTITAAKIPGYPVDGGPHYYDVTELED